MIPPFMDPTWRGCVLDRGNFDNTRLPEHLFNAIVSAAGSSKLYIAGVHVLPMLVGSILQCVLGVVLVLGSGVISRLLLRLRYAGTGVPDL